MGGDTDQLELTASADARMSPVESAEPGLNPGNAQALTLSPSGVAESISVGALGIPKGAGLGSPLPAQEEPVPLVNASSDAAANEVFPAKAAGGRLVGSLEGTPGTPEAASLEQCANVPCTLVLEGSTHGAFKAGVSAQAKDDVHKEAIAAELPLGAACAQGIPKAEVLGNLAHALGKDGTGEGLLAGDFPAAAVVSGVSVPAAMKNGSGGEGGDTQLGVRAVKPSLSASEGTTSSPRGTRGCATPSSSITGWMLDGSQESFNFRVGDILVNVTGEAAGNPEVYPVEGDIGTTSGFKVPVEPCYLAVPELDDPQASANATEPAGAPLELSTPVDGGGFAAGEIGSAVDSGLTRKDAGVGLPAGTIKLIDIKLDQQELSATKKAIVSVDRELLASKLSKVAPMQQHLASLEKPMHVVGMYGCKDSMAAIIRTNGVLLTPEHLQIMDASPGLYGFLCSNTAGGEDTLDSAGDGVHLDPPTFCVFFWHQGAVLPQEARSSVCCCFVRYVLDMAEDVLVCLEVGDVDILCSKKCATSSSKAVRRSQKGRVAVCEISKDKATIHPGFLLYCKTTASVGDRSCAALSSVCSSRCGLLYRSSSPPSKHMEQRTTYHHQEEFPSVLCSIAAKFALSWPSLGLESAETLLQLAAPEMWQEVVRITDDMWKAAEVKAEEMRSVGAAALLEDMKRIIRGFGEKYLLDIYPEKESMLQTSTGRREAKGEDVSYEDVCRRLAGLWMLQAVPDRVRPFRGLLFSDSKISLTTWDKNSSPPTQKWLCLQRLQSVKIWEEHLTFVNKEAAMRVSCLGGENGYKGPLFYGQHVLLESTDWILKKREAVLLRSVRHEAHGPVLLGEEVCLAGEGCNGDNPLHGLQLELEGDCIRECIVPWLADTIVRAKNFGKEGGGSQVQPSASDGNSMTEGSGGGASLAAKCGAEELAAYAKQRALFLDILSEQLVLTDEFSDLWNLAEKLQQNRVDLLMQQTETSAKQLWKDLINRNLSTFMLQISTTANGGVPERLKVELFSCTLKGQTVALGYRQEVNQPMQWHWELEELSPLATDLTLQGGASSNGRLQPITPQIMPKGTVLTVVGADTTVLHCSVLRSGATLSFTLNEADGVVSVFLGSSKIQKYKRAVRAVAFEERSRYTALFSQATGTIQVFRFDESFRRMDWTGVEIRLADTGSSAVEWMAFVPGCQQLLVIESGRVRAFELSQRGMTRPRHITLPAPFSGKACVSPEGSCLLILCPSPKPTAETNSVSDAPNTPIATPDSSTESVAEASADTAASAYSISSSASTKVSILDHPHANLAALDRSCDPTASSTIVSTATDSSHEGVVSQEGESSPSCDTSLESSPAEEHTRCVEKAAALQLDVYLLDTMQPLCTLPLDGVTGGTEEWEMGLAMFGKQPNLVLPHSTSGTVRSVILDITTSKRVCRVDTEGLEGTLSYSGARHGVRGSEGRATCCAALEAAYHCFDKFATSPYLADGIRRLKIHLVCSGMPHPNGSVTSEEHQNRAEWDGIKKYLSGHIYDMQSRLQRESGKDFSKLSLSVSCHQAPTVEFLGRNWAPPIGFTAWFENLCCLVPVQIARAQANSLHPLKDGMQMSHDMVYTDVRSLASLISFGPYEEVLSSWNGPIKVVSSMGKQSSGKSYLLNQLSGSLLDVSGGRCTDGVWMTVREAGGCLYVLLDFEGLGSFERTEQEDMLLSILNAAISSVTIFNKKDCHFDKETEAVFSRFQAGVSLLRADKKLFKGLFYIAIKDVASNDVESVQREFWDKITHICEGNNDNFLVKMYGGGLEVGAMAPFHDAEYVESVGDVGATLEGIQPAYHSGRGFLTDLKLLLAQIGTKDWCPLDSHRIALRISVLRMFLESALCTGRARAERADGSPSEGLLINLDTGEVIVEGPAAEGVRGVVLSDGKGSVEKVEDYGEKLTGEGGSEGISGEVMEEEEGSGKVVACPDAASGKESTNRQDMEVDVDVTPSAVTGREKGLHLASSVPDDGLVLPGGSGKGSPGECLDGLKMEFEKIFPRHTCEDAEWHALFEGFVEEVVERRGRRVHAWLRENTKEFEESGDVKQLIAEAAEALSRMRVSLTVCGSQCEECYFTCTLVKGHGSTHSCCDTHICKHKCSFCMEEAVRNGIGGLPPSVTVMNCKGKAGHDKSHDCGVQQHTCRHSCALESLASNCNQVCSRRTGHEGEHLCNSRQHFCPDRCSLQSCSNSCIIPYGKLHDQHQCHEFMCPRGCEVPGCNSTCGSKNHFHELEVPPAHFCGKEHQCREECESSGYCDVKTEILNKKEVFKGLRGEFEYERISEQSGIMKTCCKTIPPNSLTHDGPHCHSEDRRVHHFCDERCPSCEYICMEPYGHWGFHDTSHGSMKVTHFVSESPEIEVAGRKYMWGESGTAEMCMMHCKAQGRGHVHVAKCGRTCAKYLHVGARHAKCKYGPDVDMPKDEFTHSAFWARNRFKDPCTPEEQEAFALCSHYCSSQEHKRGWVWGASVGSEDEERVYCTEELWHPPVPQVSPQQGQQQAPHGYVSTDGHRFPCNHAPLTSHHVVFVIDRSYSMASNDVEPQLVAYQGQKNRLGCVYESIVRFVRTRIEETGTDHLDYMSLVLFNDEARVPFEGRPMAEQLLKRALQYDPKGNTDFCAGLSEAWEVLRRSTTSALLDGLSPVIIFLSDGAHNGGMDPTDVLDASMEEFPELVVHTVKFGEEREEEILQDMASAGSGNFSVSLDEVELAKTFEALAKSLRPAVSSLM